MTFERRHLGGRAYALISTSLESVGILAAFTERPGGDDRGSFRGLNLSLSVGDEPEAVVSNRRRVAAGLGVGAFAVAAQTHGARVVRVGRGRAGAGFLGAEGAITGADGLITRAKGVPLAVTTADCLPIVLASPKERRVAVVHAGWRGLTAGIVGRAAAAFERPSSVQVSIGPTIGPCHYEVGQDVALAVAAASGAGAVTRRAGARWFLDLPATAVGLLREAGVRRVEASELCTACHPRRFFSHRREGATGRQAAVAVLRP